MKWVFVVLCILNIGLFGWAMLERQNDQRDGSGTVGAQVKLNNLKLLGLEKSESVATGLKVATSECVQLGPFTNESLASQVVLRLSALDMESQLETSKQTVIKDYLVYLPPFKSLSEAKTKLSELNLKGIDSYIFGSGELENGLSLGVYSKKANADTIFNQVKSLGFAPIIKENTTSNEAIWIGISAEGSKYFNEGILESLQTTFPDINSRLISCN